MFIHAKYPGKDSSTGEAFARGTLIDFNPQLRTTRIVKDSKDTETGRYLAARTRSDGLVSNVFNIGGKEYYRNKRGTCEDAPACGCCTI